MSTYTAMRRSRTIQRAVCHLAGCPFCFLEAKMNNYGTTDRSSAVLHEISQQALTGFDDPLVMRPRSRSKHLVTETLAKLHQLHDELNAQLYAHPTERPSIHSPQDAYDILRCFLSVLDHEELWVINLDTRHRMMNLTKLYQGSVNSSQIRVAEVFRSAIADNAPSILLAHNHPSGDPTPSPDDVSVTHSIVEAGKLLDIEVLDHLVICTDKFVSLKERGLGF
jgi:DNA repair protein RadC